MPRPSEAPCVPTLHRRVRELPPRLLVLAAAAVLALAIGACGSDKNRVTIGLIVKRNTNPFWVTLKDTAQDTANDDNVKLLTAAGTSDIDNRSQVAAIRRMTAEGAKGILISPANPSAIVPAIEQARRKGVTVIAVDTPTQPRSAVDALYATNNFEAGVLIGRYAKAKAIERGLNPHIAMLDLAPNITSGDLRHRGFLAGFGIKDGDPQIAGSANTLGETIRAADAMRRLLSQQPDINIVYTVNEPAAFGAADALKAAGRSQDDVILVSVDGGCDAIKNGVRPGVIDATAQQYPDNMARLGVDTLAQAARGGRKPSGYRNTGVELITGDSAKGVPSKDVAFGVRNCWG
jgi:fructose transport system substrate-binding protein